MTNNLALVSIADKPHLSMPGAFYEREAAQYINTNVHYFRQLVKGGAISWTMHLGRKRKIFLRDDLDTYLQTLPRFKSEGSPTSQKGVAL
jgi:excisionase family DNA binding protein